MDFLTIFLHLLLPELINCTKIYKWNRNQLCDMENSTNNLLLLWLIFLVDFQLCSNI
jgi:hypothetical protein